MVIAVIMSSFAIDIGTLAQDARRVQLVADMVALDAMRALPPTRRPRPRPAPCATTSRTPTASTPSSWSGDRRRLGPFTTLPANLASATAVRVTASSLHHQLFPFVSQTPQNVSRKAVSNIQPRAGFTIGSSLVTIDTTRSNPVELPHRPVHPRVGDQPRPWPVGRAWPPGTVGVTALQTQLATMGFSVGTVSELLSANMTLAQLYQATANALTLGGDTANASVFNTLRLAVTSSAQMNLGGLLQVAQGSDTAALATKLNLFQLVTGSALLINGTNTLSMPAFTATIPGVSSTGLSLKVTELPQTYIGPIGGSVSTGQVELIITPKIDVNRRSACRSSVSPATSRCGSPSAAPPGRSPAPPARASPSAPTRRPSTACAQLTSLRVSRPRASSRCSTWASPASPRPSTAPRSPSPSPTRPSSPRPPPPSTPAPSPSACRPSPPTPRGPSPSWRLRSLSACSHGGIVVGRRSAALPGLLGGVDTNVVTPLLTALGLDVGSADVTALKDALQCTRPRPGRLTGSPVRSVAQGGVDQAEELLAPADSGRRSRSPARRRAARPSPTCWPCGA